MSAPRAPVRDRLVRMIGLAVLTLAYAGCSTERIDDELRAQRERQATLGVIESELRSLASSASIDRKLELIRRMELVDPEHPKVYIQLVLTQLRAKDSDEFEGTIDTFGSGHPGRTYASGLLAYFRPDDETAMQQLDAALAGYREREHLAGEAATRSARALILERRRRLDDAAQEYAVARTIFERLEDSRSLMLITTSLAKLETTRGSHETALALHRELLASHEQSGDRAEQARSLHQIGRSLYLSGRGSEAVESLRRSLLLRSETDDVLGMHFTTVQLAWVYQDLSDDARSLEYWEQALELATRSGRAKTIAVTRRGVGWALLRAGRTSAAVEMLRRSAHSLGTIDGAESDEIEASSLLGAALTRAGRRAEARTVLLTALDRARAFDRPGPEAEVLTNLARLHFLEGELSAALTYQRHAIERSAAAGDAKGRALALGNVGVIQHRLGDFAAARRTLESAADLADDVDAKRPGVLAVGALAVTLGAAGEIDEALTHHAAALERWRELGDIRRASHTLIQQATTLLTAGRTDEARAALGDALDGFREIEDTDGLVDALLAAGSFLLDSGQPGDAAERFEQAAQLMREEGHDAQLWQADAGLARIAAMSGNVERARTLFDSALERLEAVRLRIESGELRTRFLDPRAELYERAISFWLEHGGVDGSARAFGIAERERARSLLDNLTESRASLNATLDSRITARIDRSTDELNAAIVALADAADSSSRGQARQAVQAAEERLQAVRLELHREAPGYAGIVYPQPVGLAEVQRELLRANETLLEYAIGEEQALLWVVERERATVHELPPATEIESLVRRMLDAQGRAGIALGGRSRGDDAAELLGRALLPVDLVAGRRLLIAPDGPLHHVPFAALRREGRYLVEDHPIISIPSATTLKLLRDETRSATARGFLGVGDASAATALPGARLALERIAAVFPERSRSMLVGNDASHARLAALPLEEFGVIHFATHGWLDRERPSRFGLRLAPDPGSDTPGLLSLDRVSAMPLNAELVVLASCQSGRGETVRGEGLLGMSRAFLYAGAESLIVGLWNLDDRATAEFMGQFYERLGAGTPIAEALQQTQIDFLRSERRAQRQPYRWAPFSLIGNPAVTAVDATGYDRIGARQGE